MATMTVGNWLTMALVAGDTIRQNVQANRAAHKKPPKSSLKVEAPAALDEKEEEDITLGSDRAKRSSKRSRGKRQLMAPQSSGDSSSTGLQV